jgi:hypothetical protein
MTTHIVEIELNGRKFYTKYGTTGDMLVPELYEDKELSKRASVDDGVHFVDINIDGYDPWIAVVYKGSIHSPLGPYYTSCLDFEYEFFGVQQDGLIHLSQRDVLSKIDSDAICGHEYKPDIDSLKKFVFDCNLEYAMYLSSSKDKTIVDGSIYDMAKDGKVCLKCLLSDKVSRLIN